MKSPRHMISTAATLARRLCTTTGVEKVAAVTVEKFHKEEASLYQRLSILKATGGSVMHTLNEYSGEGKVITKYELERCIRSLRKFKNYPQALEILEWMENKNINFSITDHALRLDLISKVNGISKAEQYFNNLSPSFQDKSTHGTLLNCYCKSMMTDKAMELFKTMDELTFASTPLAFGNLISLHMKLGNYEKVPPLIEDMKKREITMNPFTFNALMQSYACLNKIDEAEKVFQEMEKEDKGECNWTSYTNLAVIYVKAGLFKKAEFALKKAEVTIKYHDRLAYHFLISLYASTSNLLEVKRVWNILKSALPITNNASYLVMLQALNKLDDAQGFKQCFEEWKRTFSYYDTRIANVAIKVYLRHEMIEEAELVFKEFPKKTSRALFNAHEMFMRFFLNKGCLDLALRHMKDVVFEVGGDEKWRMEVGLVSVFMKCFEEGKDVDWAEEFCKMLKKVNSMDSMVYESLIRIYVGAGISVYDIRARMESCGFEIGSEIEKLLKLV